MLKSILTLISGSALGKVLGVVRELLFAALFGAGSVADAYRFSLTAVLAPIHVFTSDALTSVFVPEYRRRKLDDKSGAGAYFRGAFVVLIALSVVIAILIAATASPLVSAVCPGFDAQTRHLAVSMVKVLSLGIPFYVLVALLISRDIGNQRFRLPAIRPFLQNVGVILALVLAYKSAHPTWIAWGFTGTYMLASVLLMFRPAGRHLSSLRRNRKELVRSGLSLLGAMRPMLLYALVFQANLIAEKAIASLIGVGAIAEVDYARLIPETAQLLLIIPIGLVSLPALVRREPAEVVRKTNAMISMAAVSLIPLSSTVFLFAGPMVTTIYVRGAFDATAAHGTALALQGMAVGLWAFSIGFLLQKVYNAQFRHGEIFRAGCIAVGANVIFSLATFRALGVLAIGLGNSVFGLVMAAMLVRGLPGLAKSLRVIAICLPVAVIHVLGGLLIERAWGSPVAALALQITWTVLLWVGTGVISRTVRDVVGSLYKGVTKRSSGDR